MGPAGLVGVHGQALDHRDHRPGRVGHVDRGERGPHVLRVPGERGDVVGEVDHVVGGQLDLRLLAEVLADRLGEPAPERVGVLVEGQREPVLRQVGRAGDLGQRGVPSGVVGCFQRRLAVTASNSSTIASASWSGIGVLKDSWSIPPSPRTGTQ